MNMEIHTSSCPVTDPLVVLREEFDDWAILFHPETAAAVGINPVGVTICKLMDGTRSPEEIILAVSDTFSDVPDTVAQDVNAFLQSLSEQGFVGYPIENF